MTSFELFHFLRPAWLWGLIPAIVVALLLLRQRLSSERWRQILDPELATWLLEPSWRGGIHLRALALGLAWSIAVVAMAGPTWEQRPLPVLRTNDLLIVVLDLSLSMYAEDIRPSRLVRARLKITDLLESRKDSQTALVVYAGDAHVVVPLTDDIRTISNLLPALEPGVMPVLGSRVQDAFTVAADLLDEAQADSGRILLITDEIPDTDQAIKAVAHRYPVFILGIGTVAGAPIPLAAVNRNGYLQTAGRTVIAALNENSLRAVAQGTGGAYMRFSTSDNDLQTLLGDHSLMGHRSEDDLDREFNLWIDMGPWLVLLVLPIALLAFRRGLIAVLVLCLFTPAEQAVAAAPDTWFSTADQQGYQALREGRVETAVELFEDPVWRAVALYHSGAYEAAAGSFTATDAESLYNRGTALARAMKLQEAQSTLREVLTLNPAHADAQHNLEIVEKLLEEQRQNADNQQGSQAEDPNSEGNESEAEQQPGEQSASETGEQDTESAEEDGETQEAQQQSDEQSGMDENEGEAPEEGEETDREALLAQQTREQEQALEQWLRRIPDQPGALLRRKFRHETKRRHQKGLTRTPKEQQPW